MDELDQLITLLNGGDRQAWRTLVQSLAGPLFRYLRPQVVDDDAAQDLVQQTFIRVFRSKLRSAGSVRTFCFHVATNLVRDSRRRASTRRRYEQGVAMADGIERSAERQAIANEAWQAAFTLPHELREVVLLRFGQGFTAAETAAVLGIPEGTVRTRQRTALERLRGMMASAPALPLLTQSLESETVSTSMPSNLTPFVEAAVMASIGSKTGANAAVLALLTLILVLGLGAGAYWMIFDSDRVGTTRASAGDRPGRGDEAEGPSPLQAYNQLEGIEPESSSALKSGGSDSSNKSLHSDHDFNTRQQQAGSSPDVPAVKPDQSASVSSDTYRATISGLVVDEEGRVVAGATLRYAFSLRAPGAEISPFDERNGTVAGGDKGEFTIEVSGQREDTHMESGLVVSAEAPGMVKSVQYHARGLRHGASLKDIKLVVCVPGSATGRVLDTGGNPIADAMLTAFQQYTGNLGIEATSESKPVKSDENGRFRIDGLRAGRWGLTVRDGRKVGSDGSNERLGLFRRANYFVVAAQTEASVPDVVMGLDTKARFRLVSDDGHVVARVRGRIEFSGAGWSHGYELYADKQGYVALSQLHPDFTAAEVFVKGFEGGQPWRFVLIEGQENDLGEVRLTRATQHSAKD